MMSAPNRREVASRKVKIFQDMAASLVKSGISANQVSVLSVGFALLGAVGLYQVPLAGSTMSAFVFALVALIGIQGRLICNLLDGLVAIEGKQKTAVGDLYNEVPDRVSDSVLLIGAGWGLLEAGLSYGLYLGLLASLLAMATAYVRLIGGSLKLAQSFRGPMAKQHRMGLLNLGVIGAVIEMLVTGQAQYAMTSALVLIAIGSAITSVLRLNGIAALLREGDR